MEKTLISYHRLCGDTAAHLSRVRPGTFDNAIDPVQTEAFIADPLHEMVLACEGGQTIGLASGQVMLHPDKQPSFFINEVGVHSDLRRRGIGTELTRLLLQIAGERGCDGIWLATEETNIAARALYRRQGARESTGIVVYDWGGVMDDHTG